MTTEQDRTAIRPPDSASSPATSPPSIEAANLLGGHREIVILHRGERYRLRVTQSDKLILTK